MADGVQIILPSLEVVVEVDVFVFRSEAILGGGRGVVACPVPDIKVNQLLIPTRLGRGGGGSIL